MRKYLQLCFMMAFICKANVSISQVTNPPPDSLRIIQIIKGLSLREITIDSFTRIQTIAGDVVLYEGTTKFTCDSAVINRRLNIMEAFGRVRINQGDSLFTYSDYLKYLGNEKIAYLKKNVRLTDKKATLTTHELEYNLTTHIGKYFNGGKVINGKTVLTSTDGVYYEDTKDVYFINKVDVVDPKTRIKADSLLYNTQHQKLNFIGKTFIKNKDGDIVTTQGTYDLNNGNAFFGNNSVIKDSSGRVYTARDIAFDDKLGQTQFQGQAIIKDTANKFIIMGNEIFSSKKNNSFLATKKPVLITWDGNDTTYISADTLFSGYTVYLETDTTVKDSLKLPLHDSTNVLTGDSVRLPDADSFIITKTDSLVIKKTDSVAVIKTGQASIKKLPRDKTVKDPLPAKTLQNKGPGKTKPDSSIRYFLAYHHVRVFNDSLQAMGDSLFYSGADSIFRLFYDPVIWSGKNQVTGDTIFLYTKNKKVQQVYVFENGIIVNRINSEFYNQVEGKTINGYFKNGEIDYMRVKGSPAESIYYVQDKDSAYTGMNRADGSVIDVYFLNQKVDQVKILNDIHGKLYPMRRIPADQKFLRKFTWQEKRRPKNKLELFE